MLLVLIMAVVLLPLANQVFVLQKLKLNCAK